MAKKEKTIEENMEELTTLLDQLEQGDISLEESFQFYEKGMKLVKECNDKIDKVEKKIIILSKEGEEDEF